MASCIGCVFVLPTECAFTPAVTAAITAPVIHVRFITLSLLARAASAARGSSIEMSGTPRLIPPALAIDAIDEME
jgi:hypothetical protein